MSDAVVVDAYAWVEYAAGSATGERARAVIEGEFSLYTPAIVVAELSDRSTRTDRREAWRTDLFPYIRRQTTIVPLDDSIADRVGTIKWELRETSPNVGLADAIVLATARETEGQVLTGDADFLDPVLRDEVIDITEG